MGAGDIINSFLNRVGLDLIRLPRRGPAERSRVPKTVFFLLPGRHDSRRLAAITDVICRSLPGRLHYRAVPAGGTFPPPPGFPVDWGTIDPRGCLWTPGDYAVLLAGSATEDMPAKEFLPLIEGYLHALGSGAVGWIMPPPPTGHADSRTADLIRLALQRSRAVFSFDKETAGRIREMAGDRVCLRVLSPADLEEGILAVIPRYPGEETTGRISLISTCKGRLDQLKKNVPTCLSQKDDNYEYVVVDYDCPQKTADWLRENSDPRLVTVKIFNKPYFDQSHARNLGARFASGPILVFIDADTVLQPGFLTSVRRRLDAGTFLVTSMVLSGERDYGSGAGLLGYGGIIACWKRDWEGVRGFDENMPGWGGEDDDFRRRLRAAGLTPILFDLSLCRALDHDETSRTEFYREKEKGVTSRDNLRRGENPLRKLPPDFGRGDSASPIEVYYHAPPPADER